MKSKNKDDVTGIFFCDGFDTAIKPLGTRGLFLNYLKTINHEQGKGFNLNEPIIICAIENNTAINEQDLKDCKEGTVLAGFKQGNRWDLYCISANKLLELHNKSESDRVGINIKKINQDKWKRINI